MASIEARGFVNKLELKESAKGPYAKFDLAVQQKRKDKDKNEVKETLYFRCIDFNPTNLPAEGDYVGVTGYVTLTKWEKGINVDVSVKSYEKLEQRAKEPRTNGRTGGSKASDAPPSDPFALSPGKP